jgi:anti-sigma B factor antagonist
MALRDTRIEVGTPEDDGAVPIVLTGELDQASADQLREALEEAVGEHAAVIRVDATDVKLLDSTSLGLLLFFARKLLDRGGYLELTYATQTVRRTLEIASLGRAMRVIDAREDDSGRLSHR